MATLTVGSLFAGIGGFDLGLERAGFEIKWQVEIDPFCRAVLAKHWPQVRRYEDVRTVGAELAAVDVLCGGLPCQPHSLAGRRGGAEDERDLWPQFARLIREVRPRWVVAENVPGLLSSESGWFFGKVLGDLAESGYDAEWDCLPASAFGAPHRRDRVWIVAYPMREEWRLQPVSERGSGNQAIARDNGAARLVADATGERFDQGPDADRRSLEAVGEAEAEVKGCAVQFINASTGAASHAYGGDEHRRCGDVQMGRIWGTCAAQGDVYGDGTQWRTEPDVGRVAHGVPARVDRLRGMGNAIVPQIAEWIGSRIIEADARR